MACTARSSRGSSRSGTTAGRVVRWFGTNTDISEAKRAEEALKEADRRKDEFLAMLAHELRNPLAAIRNAVALSRAQDPADPELEWGRDVIDRQSRQLSRLVDDLLDVSRIGQGKVVLRREPLDVRDVVARAVEVVRPLVDEKRQALSVSLPPSPLPADADPARLEQVVANLLTNAAKYTDEAGRITLAGAREGDEVVVRVRDTGIGIPAEALESVFGLFAQIDPATRPRQGGPGHRADAGAGPGRVARGPGLRPPARDPAGGASSRCGCPRSRGRPPRSRGRRRARRGPLVGARRVLVVDDDADNASGLSRLLKRLGHDVRVAHDGGSALEVARGHRPEVVLLDIGLPGLDGYEVAKRLRAEGCAGTP